MLKDLIIVSAHGIEMQFASIGSVRRRDFIFDPNEDGTIKPIVVALRYPVLERFLPEPHRYLRERNKKVTPNTQKLVVNIPAAKLAPKRTTSIPNAHAAHAGEGGSQSGGTRGDS